MIALTQSGFDFGEVVANRLPDFEVWENAVSGEFINGAKREAAICGCLFAVFLRSGKAGSGSGECGVRFHGNAGCWPMLREHAVSPLRLFGTTKAGSFASPAAPLDGLPHFACQSVERTSLRQWWNVRTILPQQLKGHASTPFHFSGFTSP